MTDRRREVQELREKIAKVDSEIRERLDARARLSLEIHSLVEAEPPGANGTEREWLDRVSAGAPPSASPAGGMPEASLKAIFRAIRAAGRAIEQPVRVAVAGAEGGFCYQVALEVFGATTQIIEAPSADGALSEVTRNRAAFAVFPLESSVEGVMQSALLTLAETDIMLVGERVAGATYELMSLVRDRAQLERIYLTAAAHAACQSYLDKELPQATVIDVRSPRVAADLARESEASGAIVPEPTGAKAGLDVLQVNVSDIADLKYRYAIAGQRPAARTGHDVCSMLFATDNQPGALYEILRHFAERGINMRKLQTLQVRRDGFDFYFYAEIHGHASDRPVVTALEAVKRSVRYFRLLGSFPSGI